jgi:hypothetical protein
MNSSGTGNPNPASVPASLTGTQLGRTALQLSPSTADEAAALAERLVGDLLPQSVQSWLTDTEQAQAVSGSVGMKLPARPELTTADRETLTAALQSLSDLLAPSGRRGTELEQEVMKLFAAFNVYTGDQAKLRAQVLVWSEELEELPLFAIRKAYKWAVRGGDKLPSLASFLGDVRLAIGSGVLARRALLQRLLTE